MPPLCKGRGCPVDTFVEDKSADRPGRGERGCPVDTFVEDKSADRPGRRDRWHGEAVTEGL